MEMAVGIGRPVMEDELLAAPGGFPQPAEEIVASASAPGSRARAAAAWRACRTRSWAGRRSRDNRSSSAGLWGRRGRWKREARERQGCPWRSGREAGPARRTCAPAGYTRPAPPSASVRRCPGRNRKYAFRDRPPCLRRSDGYRDWRSRGARPCSPSSVRSRPRRRRPRARDGPSRRARGWRSGNPSSRPRLSPWRTRPSISQQRPSCAAAAPGLPSRRQARILVEEYTVSPQPVTGSTTSNPTPAPFGPARQRFDIALRRS